MLGSNLSAVAGDGDMGGYAVNCILPLSHVSVLKAINPGGLGAGPH
jgi:hypothetical protein